MDIKFSNYRYYPSLRSRPAEVMGYENLANRQKDLIVPTFTLGAWPRQSDISYPLDKVVFAAGGRPFVLDLTSETSYATSAIWSLKSSEGNFSAWRDFVNAIDNPVIPVVQVTQEAKISEIVRQARAFENTGINKLAFKIRNYGEDSSKIIPALSALDDVNNALVIIDAGYIRDTLSASLAASISTINDIRDEVEDAEIVLTSTSFPASVVPFLDPSSSGKRGLISMQESHLHAAIGDDVAIYGDHGSIHSRVYITSGGRYTPRIDYPLNDAWAFERRPDSKGEAYVDAARKLIASYREIEDDESWGAGRIRQAAEGEIEGMKTPAFWIAARVNMHISRQIALRCSGSLRDEEDFYVEDIF